MDSRFFKARDLGELQSIRKSLEGELLGKLREEISRAKPGDRRALGIKLNELKGRINSSYEEHRMRLLYVPPKVDLLLDGHLDNNLDHSFNPLSQVRSDLIQFFDRLGFLIESGEEIVTTGENFDNLLIGQDHPSRSSSETFYLDGNAFPGGDYVLRTHCTSNTISYLSGLVDKGPEIRYVTLGAVYRNDDEGNRHTHQFHQLDFIWLKKGLVMGNIKWFLSLICEHIFGRDREYRFRNSFFPFTQPSMELDIRCNCMGQGDCPICRGSGWIEVLGAGFFRHEILSRVGFSQDYEGIAGGIGLERIALLKYQIDDIRKIYKNDFSFLRDDY